jgi:hypothetical protein
MLSVAEIITMARQETGTTQSEISDATCLTYINVDYPKVLNKIFFMDKNYCQTQRKTDLILGQKTYSLLDPIQVWSPGGPLFGQMDIEKVMVQLDPSNSRSYECKIVDYDNFREDMSVYEKNQPKSEPLVILWDRQITIFPTPTIDVSWWMTLIGTKKAYKLTLSGAGSTTSDILIPEQYQDILVWALIPWLYRARKLPNDVAIANQEFEKKMIELLYQISVKQTTPSTGILNSYDNLT